MKNAIPALIVAALLLVPVPALAVEQTVTLKVNGMSCASCPYQVQSALKRVNGVKAATASLENGNAVVTFDDAVTNVAALTAATTSVGFPSVAAGADQTKASTKKRGSQ